MGEENHIIEQDQSQVQEAEAARILEAEYGALAPLVDEGGLTRCLTRPEDQEALAKEIGQLQGRIIEVLRQAGVEVREVEPKAEVPIRETVVSRCLGHEDPDWSRFVNLPDREIRHGWTRLYKDTGLIKTGETMVTNLQVVDTKHRILVNGSDWDRPPRFDPERGSAEVVNVNLRRLAETALANPDGYAVINGWARFSRPKTAEVCPGVSTTVGHLALIRKPEAPTVQTAGPAPKT